MVFKIQIIPTLEPGEVLLKEEEETIYAHSMEDIINFFKEYNITPDEYYDKGLD